MFPYQQKVELRAAASTLETAEWAGDRVFRTFSPQQKKCEERAAVDCERAVALSAVHGDRL